MNQGKKERKASLSIQFIFLFFIGTIAAVVIIGLLTDWAFDARRIMKGLFSDDETEIPDNQKVYLKDCNDIVGETVKQAKLCNQFAKQGQLHGNEICYSLFMPDPGCPIVALNIDDIDDDLTSASIAHSISALKPGNIDKIIISYSYDDEEVKIE